MSLKSVFNYLICKYTRTIIYYYPNLKYTYQYILSLYDQLFPRHLTGNYLTDITRNGIQLPNLEIM